MLCVPTKPDKLILLSWYNFRGRKGHIPKPVKINRSSANLSEFWTRLKVKCVSEYITSYFVLLQNVSFPWSSCVMHLLLLNTAVGLYSVCGGLSQQIFLLSRYQRAECGFNIDKMHLETMADLLKVMKRRPQGIPLGAGKVDNSSLHPTNLQHSAYSWGTL